MTSFHDADTPPSALRTSLVGLGLCLALAACGDDTTGAGGSGGSSSSGDGGATSSTGDGGSTTSTGDGGSTGAGDGGGGAAAEPTRLGTLGVGRGTYGALPPDELWTSAYLFASFAAEPASTESPCEVTTVGSCSVTDCPADSPAEPSPFVSAGAITVEGLTSPVTALPTEAGEYWVDVEGDRTSADEPFASGASVRVAAAGDVVPAFDVELPAPARLNVTSPVPDDDLVVTRDEELLLTWEHGPGEGGVSVILQVEEPESPDEGVRTISVQCNADVVDGAVALPADVLASLPATEEAYLFVIAREETEVVAGDWRVHASVADFTMLYESVEIR